MIMEIGIVAGEIWHFLDQRKECFVKELIQNVDRDRETILMSLGWLAREGHVILTKEEKDYKIVLRFQDMEEFCVVLVTCGSDGEAEKIAEKLVELKLSACVNIIPKIKSIYRWEGKIQNADEILLLIKTRRSLFPEAMEAIRKQHSYSCPEILALPIADGFEAYMSWLGENTTK